jgi:hypothetical protein
MQRLRSGCRFFRATLEKRILITSPLESEYLSPMNVQRWPLFRYAGRLERAPAATIRTEQRALGGGVGRGVRVVTHRGRAGAQL